MEMTAVWAAVLITYGFFPGIAMQPSGSGTNEVLPLDLAPNSVDDMYDGCKDQMSKVVKEKLENEKNTNSNFKEVWDQAANLKTLKSKLEKEQVVALNVYTSGKGNFYLEFNAAVRSQGSEYKTGFRFQALHFYLTRAIQTLKDIHFDEDPCMTGYRRDNHFFSQDVLNKEIRFGYFTSSSRIKYVNPERFGTKSCFEIYTCFGADITNFSKFKEGEGEVLIPPYEVFKVTEIQKKSKNNKLPCEVVYKLKSTRTLSNLNCILFPK